MKKISVILLVLFVSTAFAQTAKRPLKLDDMARIRDVRDPQISPDGQWVAYVVGTTDAKEDKQSSHIWLASYDGKIDRQLTFSMDSEGGPKWSPDGKFLAFTSGRPGPAKGSQVWVLPMSGGEAYQLTETKGRLQSFEWSPDGKKMALVIGDPDPDDPANQPERPAGAAGAAGAAGSGPKPPKPIVIDRYKYKQDVQGYLLSGRHSYIYLLDIATSRKTERLTNGKPDESGPVWSPDGTKIAFIDNHNPDPDRDDGGSVFVADAKPASAEKQLTGPNDRVSRGRVEWSPDSKNILFIEGDEKKYGAYSQSHLAIVPADGSSQPHRFAEVEALDRGVSSPHYGHKGDVITFLVNDDRYNYGAVLFNGKVVYPMGKNAVISSPTFADNGNHAVIAGGDTKFNEIYVWDNGQLRQLTHQNDALLAELDLAPGEDVQFKSKDGVTDVHGILTKPVGYKAGTKVPLLLRIHGGPNGQDEHNFSFERQFFAANGYAVLNVNYRGSSGRGQKYSRAIFADWGHHEVEDLEGGVEYAIASGITDAQHLGVGGWSYGGILTDYMIASDPRFKAATSGAGTAFTVAFYGTDQYITQYDYEIGPPWDPKAWDTYQRISYPFLHNDRITTPTLFLGGERDFNVPVQGGQQMYQALRSRGIETQLVIYPNEFHGIRRPSYVKDRYERYLAWYDNHLKPKPPEQKKAEAATTTTPSSEKE